MRRSLLRGSPTRERTDRMSELQSTPNTIELAAEIVSAFVSNNSVPAVELPTLIGSVHDALTKAANGLAQQPAEEPKAPAVSIKKSVQPDYIVCLDDGKKFKSLKRHLRTTYNLTPDQYRTKWGLAHDDPRGAPNSAAAPPEPAQPMGLGARRRKAAEAAQPAAPVKGRRKKAA